MTDDASLVLVFVDGSLINGDDLSLLASLAAVGIRGVVVGDVGAGLAMELPADLQRVDALPRPMANGAWHIAAALPDDADRAAWSQTVVIGPRITRRRSLTGLRTARDLRTALLELSSEHAL